MILKHALRNALLPIVTLLGFELPGLFSGALITEKSSTGRAPGISISIRWRRAITRY